MAERMNLAALVAILLTPVSAQVSDPCINVTCSNGLYCRESPSQASAAECFDPCKVANCSSKQLCRLQRVQCFRPPCPPVGVCRDREPAVHPGSCPAPSGMAGICIYDPMVNCLNDTKCTPEEKCCSEGCGKVCKTALAEGTTTSKPALIATRASINPCTYVKCSAGFECRLLSDPGCRDGNFCSLFAVCRPNANSMGPCPTGQPVLNGNFTEIFCGHGPFHQDCPQQTYCNVEASDRYAVCCFDNAAPTTTSAAVGSPCELVDCANNLYCRENAATGAAECFDPCDEVSCGVDQFCRLQHDDCTRYPCPPVGECRDRVPLVHPGSCPLTDGGFGSCLFDPLYNCINDTECLKDEKCCSNGCSKVCQQAIATSLAPTTDIVQYTCDMVDCDDGTYCRENAQTMEPECFDPCQEAGCSQTQLCRLQRVECIRAPCPPMAVCRNKEPAIHVGRCPADSGNPGLCIFDPFVNCLNDSECDSGEKCCSEGCGKICKNSEFETPHDITDPCEDVGCASGYECRLQASGTAQNSNGGGIIPVCTGIDNSTNHCPYGKAVLESDTFNNVYCGLGAPWGCPQGTTCNVHPLDYWAVCCLDDSEPLTTPGSTPPSVFDPCSDMRCAGGHECRLQVDRNCRRDDSCPLTPVCKAMDGKCPIGRPVLAPNCSTPLFCGEGYAHQECPVGTFCNQDPWEGSVCCLDDGTHVTTTTTMRPILKNPCINVICRPNQYCREQAVTRNAECFDPCKEADCGSFQVCRVKNVTCIRAPCPPIAVCEDPCQNARCADNQKCRVLNGTCQTSPCPPIAVCDDDIPPPPPTPEPFDDPCEDAVCDTGYECRLQVDWECPDGPCPLLAVCALANISTNYCPGKRKPVLAPASAVNLFCGRGPSHQECPETTTCIVAPGDQYAVCCVEEDGQEDKDASTQPPNSTVYPGVERHDVVCTTSSMEILVPETWLPYRHVTLRNPSCVLTSNGTHHAITVPLSDCSTSIEVMADNILFVNELIATDSATGGQVRVHVACRYPRLENITISYLPVASQTAFYEIGDGRIDVVLGLFTDASFTTPLATTGGALQVKGSDKVYVQLAVLTLVHPDLAVQARSCVASPSTSPVDASRVELIRDGCAVSALVTVLPSNLTTYRFTLRGGAFSFQVVYIHCQAALCVRGPSCQPQCGTAVPVGRRRRAAEDSPAHLLSAGPLFVADETGGAGTVSALTVVTSSLAAVFLVAVVAMAVALRRASLRAASRQQPLLASSS